MHKFEAFLIRLAYLISLVMLLTYWLLTESHHLFQMNLVAYPKSSEDRNRVKEKSHNFNYLACFQSYPSFQIRVSNVFPMQA